MSEISKWPQNLENATEACSVGLTSGSGHFELRIKPLDYRWGQRHRRKGGSSPDRQLEPRPASKTPNF